MDFQKLSAEKTKSSMQKSTAYSAHLQRQSQSTCAMARSILPTAVSHSPTNASEAFVILAAAAAASASRSVSRWAESRAACNCVRTACEWSVQCERASERQERYEMNIDAQQSKISNGV
jgi:hypothetical protein